MRTRQVRWSEGMLVLPHHLQAAESSALDWLATSHDWLRPYGYGIWSLEVNLAALANYEVRIPRLEARLKDGTLVSVPENSQLQMLDVRPAFEAHSEVYVYLLIPQIVPGRANASYGKQGDDEEHRYLVVTERREELNDGDNTREIDTHAFNIRLRAQPKLVSPGGYESLPLFKLRRSRQPGAVPEIDPRYIPPVLSCAANNTLQHDILLTICSQVGAFIKTQAETLTTQGGWAEANLPQVHQGILRLHAANCSYPALLQLFQSRGLHPFQAYVELCRLIGQLSIARSDWQPPALPPYDHDDLGRVFAALQREIDLLFQADATTAKILRFPFIGTGNWMEVSLEKGWLGENYEFFIGIRSELAPEALEKLFGDNHLDWKLASSRKIMQVFQNAESGLIVQRYTGQHAMLPQLKGVTYFRVDNSGPYWQQLAAVPTLALKVNPRFLRSNPAGTNMVTVLDQREQPCDMALDLFVIQNA